MCDSGVFAWCLLLLSAPSTKPWSISQTRFWSGQGGAWRWKVHQSPRRCLVPSAPSLHLTGTRRDLSGTAQAAPDRPPWHHHRHPWPLVRPNKLTCAMSRQVQTSPVGGWKVAHPDVSRPRFALRRALTRVAGGADPDRAGEMKGTWLEWKFEVDSDCPSILVVFLGGVLLRKFEVLTAPRST